MNLNRVVVSWLKYLNMLVLLASLSACSNFKFFTEDEAAKVAPPVSPALATIESHDFSLTKGDEVVGELSQVPVWEGDTFSDLARHFGLGFQHLEEANPTMDSWAPAAGAQVLLPTQFILPDAPHKGIVVNLAAMRLFYFLNDNQLKTYPIGIGKEGRSTPTGLMRVERKTKHPIWYVPESIRNDHALKGDPLPASVPAGPDNPLGDYAFYLSEPSYLIHGTNKPYSIGFRASNGCVRLYPENIDLLFKNVPEKTSVKIVNQPYLLGTLAGDLYLEAHKPYEELNDKQVKKNILQKIKDVEKKQALKVDWPKVETTLQEALGIPVPILQDTLTVDDLINRSIRLLHPDKLYLQPEVNSGGHNKDKQWYVLVDKNMEQRDAQKMAAILNHQGPQIPAMSFEDQGKYLVLAGPYDDAKSAKATVKRLKIDLELVGKILPPLGK